jgi:hypothetical protein
VIRREIAFGDGEDPVAQWTVGSLVPYLLQRVLLRIPGLTRAGLTLAVSGMR